jgi:hypothetical protein
MADNKSDEQKSAKGSPKWSARIDHASDYITVDFKDLPVLVSGVDFQKTQESIFEMARTHGHKSTIKYVVVSKQKYNSLVKKDPMYFWRYGLIPISGYNKDGYKIRL